MDAGPAPHGLLGPCRECGVPLPAGTERYCVHCGADVTPHVAAVGDDPAAAEPSWFEAPDRDAGPPDGSVTLPAPLTPGPGRLGVRRPTTWSSGDFRAPSPTDGHGLDLAPEPPPGVEWNGPVAPTPADAGEGDAPEGARDSASDRVPGADGADGAGDPAGPGEAVAEAGDAAPEAAEAAPAPFTWPADLAAVEELLPFAPQRPVSAGPIRLEIAYPPDVAVPPDLAAPRAPGGAARTVPGGPADLPGFPPPAPGAPAPVLGAPGPASPRPAPPWPASLRPAPPVPGPPVPGAPVPPAPGPHAAAGPVPGPAGYHRVIDLGAPGSGPPIAAPDGAPPLARPPFRPSPPGTAFAPAPGAARRGPALPLLLVVAGLVLVAATGGTLWWLASRSDPDPGTTTAAAASSGAVPAPLPGTTAATGADDPTALAGTSGAAGDVAPSGSPSASPSASATTSAAEFVATVDGLLGESASARTGVSAAVASLQTCRADATRAATTLREAGKARSSLAGRGGAVPTGGVAGASDVVARFVEMQQASAAADDAFAAWAGEIARSGCRNGAPRTANWAAGNQHSAEATAAKTRFVELWNPLATANGRPARSADAI